MKAGLHRTKIGDPIFKIQVPKFEFEKSQEDPGPRSKQPSPARNGNGQDRYGRGSPVQIKARSLSRKRQEKSDTSKSFIEPASPIPWIKEMRDQKGANPYKNGATRHPERVLFKTLARDETNEHLHDSDGEQNTSFTAQTTLQPTKQLSKYDVWDEEYPLPVWAEKCKASDAPSHAKCPIYVNYNYVWVDVRVLGWDEEKKKFFIQICESGIMKYVGRLSLLFHDENPEKFRERVEVAKKRQFIAEDEMRFYRFVDSLSDEEVAKLPTETKKSVLGRMYRKKKKEGEEDYNPTSIANHMQEVERLYRLHLKKFNVIQEMTDPETHAKFKAQRIKIRERDNFCPYLNLFVKLNYPFNEVLKKVSDKHVSAKESWTKTVNMMANKTSQFAKHAIFFTNPTSRDLPYELEFFSQTQQGNYLLASSTLKTHWRDYLMGEVQDLLRNTYNFYSVGKDQYFDTEFQKFMLKLDLIFNSYVRENVVNYTINTWLNFLRSFVHPNSSETTQGLWPISDLPLIKITIKLREKKKKKDKDKKKDKKKEKEKDEEEDKIDESEEDDDGEMIYFSPSKEKVIRGLIKPMELLIELSNSLNKLEPDLVPFLYLPKTCSYPLKMDHPIIKKANDTIRDYTEIGFREPNDIINKFRKYQFLFEKSNKDLPKTLFSEGRPTAQKLRDALQQLNQAMREVGSLCINEKNTLFFQVKTAEIKDIINTKATETFHAILKKTSELSVEMVAGIQKGYNEMMDRLNVDPEDEKQLVALKEEIQFHEKRIEEYEVQVRQVTEYLDILEDSNYEYKESDWSNFWNLKVMPPDIRMTVLDSQKRAGIKEAKFQERLEHEKEKFLIDLKAYENEFQVVSRFSVYKNVARFTQEVHILKEKLMNGQETVRSFNEREILFKLPTSDYESLNDLVQRFEPFNKMWDLCFDFDSSSTEWYTEPFSKLNYPTIDKKMDTITKECQRLTKFFADSSEEASTVLRDLKVEIDKFRTQMPLIALLTTEAMHKKPQTWLEIYEKCGLKEKDVQENFTLTYFVDKKLLQHLEILEEISTKAEKQWTIEKKLSEMNEKVKNMTIELIPHKSGISLVKTVEETQQFLDEFLNLIQMLKASPHIKQILRRATEIENRFIVIQDALEKWMKCQRGWMYLEPIFSSEDIIKKLPQDYRKFEIIDKFFRATMETVAKEAKPFDSPEIDLEKLNIEFDAHNKTLETIQKSLTDYLETKRRAFARFFFLSDEELLEILSETKDPTKVQPHMSKCFEAINEVEFSEELEVISMISAEKEKVKFIRPVNVTEGEKKGNVEKWLLEVESIMQKTLHHICKESIKDSDTPRTIWVRKWPGQIILAVNQARWTVGVEGAIMKKNEIDLDGFLKLLNKDLDDVVELVRGDLTSLERMTLGALVVIDVHARDVVQEMVNKGVESINDFEWISQLRYYWEDNALKVRMINAELRYNFEYLGNSPRLVITPLTDRCYRTLLGAFYLQYGGAPEGPAGTGKTESVKDLAKALAIMCVVFNCSDTLNYLAMRKFFKGLASSGGWCCFDEFNRIDLEVLSVIAQQVMQIQEAIKLKRKNFTFDGEELSLISTCAINITMNPGYAGRSELPDNLKALFRPCAMMVPDYAMISEIMLYSYGFKDARTLARKIVASLKLSSEQLSSQQHYDFGMRAVKSILTAAGQLKRVMKEEEGIICMRALYDVNLPKFTMNDIPLFLSITSDLFPGIKMPNPDYELLEGALEHVILEHNLIPEKAFMKKCIQLYETIMVRHGLMLVGAAFSGKSKVLESLQRAMNHLKGQDSFTGAFTYKMNPKSIKIEQLYGKFDPDSKAWSDGVLCILMRMAVKDVENPERKWLLFDGPVDAVWIENMNTVLDDNKKLCLTSGEIIKMSPQMTMMFEVEDLIHASPATVSRCGMVFLETKNLGWEALIKAYAQRLPELWKNHKDMILSTMRWFMDACLAYVRKFGKFPMAISEMNMANSTISLMEIFLLPYEKEGKLPKEIDDTLNNLIFYSTVWSIGGVIEEDCRPGFHEFVIKLLACNDVVEMFGIDPNMTPFEPRAYKFKLNDAPNIFDITYDVSKGLWVNWIQTIPAFNLNKNLQFHELIIPTVESLRTGYFMNLCVKNSKHCLFTGLTGTGKTISIINELNTNFYNEDYSNLSTCFSGQTQANQAQRTIEAKMTTRRRKGVFGCEDRKKYLVIFIDDVNMPAKEKYDAQPPIEILRQWMDYGGWYDLETKEFKQLVDMIFVGAMGPPSAGRNTITARYSRHFLIQYVEPFSTTSLKKIFTNVLEWYFLNLGSPSKAITALRDGIVASTIELYNKIKVSKELLPTPAKSHYVYNLRDISKVFQGISKASIKSLNDDGDFIKLWAHECLRVFYDRLISDEDREFFLKMLKEMLKTNFKRDWASLVQVEPLLWASFVPTIYPDGDTSKKPLTNIYCELVNRDAMKKAAENALEEYNNFTTNKMNLVLFTNAIEHIIKVVRVIGTPFGHCLLVGVGGSGRRSLATLATSIAGYDLFQVEITKAYDQKTWVEDLQKVLKQVGLDNKPTVFLFADTQIWKESILEDISSLLNNGEIPNLFPTEEKAKIIEEVSSNFPNGTPNQKYAYFVSKCKENLHMIIALSPVGEAFRRRLRTFPSLVNCTTIDWFLPWPEEALRSVAVSTLKDLTLEEKVKEGIIDICVDMQRRVTDLSVRFYQELRKHYYVTPTSYLELLSTFKRLLDQRNTKVFGSIHRYKSGLEKLLSTEKEVAKMQEELIELTPQLEKKSQEAQLMIIKIRDETKIADAQREICEKEEAECNLQKEEAEKLKAECQAELDKVLPILKEAESALDQVDKNELNTLKSYQKVVAPIEVTMKAMCIMKGIGPEKKKEGMVTIEDWWGAAKKKLLNNIDQLMKDVKSYGVEKIAQIDGKIITKLKEFFNNPDFDEKTVSRASGSAASLSKWIRAVVQTYEAYLVVDPKQKELARAEAALKQAEETLALKKAQLQQVLDKIAGLQKEYDETKAEKDALEAKCEKCKIQIERATKLTEELGGEKKMWKKRAEELEESTKAITGDVLLCSGIIAYMGAFPLAYREECQSAWEGLLQQFGIARTPDFKLQTTLSDAVTIGNWTNKYKLPNDVISIDNAIILNNSTRFPLMIDPQLQANRWIKELEKGADKQDKDKDKDKGEREGREGRGPKRERLLVIRPTQATNEYAMNLELCISQGLPVLLENIDENIDPLFDSIISQKKVKQGGFWKLKFGDNWVDYSPDFRFYMTTKLPKPHYPPEICVKVTLLNFTVTPEGLEDNMLNIVVKAEEPNMEEKRQNNIIEFFKNKDKQKTTEDNILQMLSEASGNILDNVELIETLKRSKFEASEIENKLDEQKKDQVKFQAIRNFYQRVAKRVSALFFVVADLANIEPVYQYSLDWYIGLYLEAIRSATPGKDKRCENIIEKFTEILYDNVCRSLLEKDKLLFSFLLCMKILHSENKVTTQELRFLMVGGTKTDAPKPNPTDGWLSEKQWASFCEMTETFPEKFKNFDDDFTLKRNDWKEVFNSPEPMQVDWPASWSKKLGPIQKLTVLRILRPDKAVPAIQALITSEMGDHFVEGSGALDLGAVYKDSERNRNEPIIFILSPGVDPIAEIMKLADKMGSRGNVLPLSLGQGMDKIALQSIDMSVQEGKWVVLQNCHLAPSFMPQLERKIELLPIDSHDNYRMWLTTMPSDKFPVSVLQNGIKLTNEPPKGLKNNINRSYRGLDPKKFEECTKSPEYKKLLFGLCFFHAHVQERKKFGPLGWNIPYEFSAADLAISMSQLRIFLDQFPEIPWDALNYMVAEANYGGRVTDPMDRRLIKVILRDFYTEDILDDRYRFSPSGIYYAPPDGPLDNYKDFIRDLPLNDTAEIFGLHSNAEISSAINETNQLLGTALLLQPRSVGGAGGSSTEEIMKEKCHSILAKVPKPFDLDEAIKKYPVKYEESMNTVLQQEILRFNRLVVTVRKSLENLNKAIEGFVVMSAELDEVFNKMFDNLVPDMWHKVAYPSRKPLGSWINDLIDRLAFIQKWIDEGPPPSFWISGFYFTQSFLTGTLQNYARKTQIAIDTLAFDFYVIKKENDPKCDITKQPEDGCYIYGLFLDGCRWDDKDMVLAEPHPKILNYKVPYIWLIPMRQADIDKNKHTYECPVYKTSRRAGTLSTTGHSTNFVVHIKVPMAPEHDQKHWIKRGVAMLTQLDD